MTFNCIYSFRPILDHFCFNTLRLQILYLEFVPFHDRDLAYFMT
jgi:hypothetical protein